MANFRHINPKNLSHIVPTWAVGASPFLLAQQLEGCFGDLASKSRKGTWHKTHWVEVDARGDVASIRVAEKDGGPGDDNAGYMIFDCASPLGGECQVKLPLWAVFKGERELRGTHTVYLHEMQGDGKVLRYFGITKQRWFDRLGQHVSSAASGSRLVFHEAIRRNQDARKAHWVFIVGATYEQAMNEEESLVDEFSLYPMGLNMIPGGFAGMAYLHKLGLAAASAKERDKLIEDIAQRDTVAGQPNPLCAARWASDQDFANRIICGHGNRLTVEQVLGIRALGDFGKPASEIAERLGLSGPDRVRRVLSGSRYSRVA